AAFRRGDHLHQRAAIARGRDHHRFAGQGQRHEDLAALNLGDTLALMAEAGDGCGDGHGFPVLAEEVQYKVPAPKPTGRDFPPFLPLAPCGRGTENPRSADFQGEGFSPHILWVKRPPHPPFGHLLPQGEKEERPYRLAHSRRLASPTNGTPACSLSPDAQVLTVDTPSVQPAGLSFLAKRVAWAFSSGINSPLSPA